MNTKDKIQQVKDLVHYSLIQAKKNPGTMNMFNGKHWVDAKDALQSVEEVLQKLQEAQELIESVNAEYLAKNYQGFTAHSVREYLKK